MGTKPILTTFAPSDWPTESTASAPPTHQSLKSADTKKRLIEGAIRCIVKLGYSKTTTPRVAAEAGMSRGAMLHHFETGDALMRAVIAELHEKRLCAIRRAGDIVGHDVHAIVRTYWDQLSSPIFTAFHELSIAARTDKGWPGYSNRRRPSFASGATPCPSKPFPNGKRTAPTSIWP